MLKAIIDNLDSVDQAFRGEYRPGTADEGLEGKFVLSVEALDGWNLENVNGLKTALSTERTQHNTAKQQLKAFEGIDPEKAKTAIAKLDEFGTLDPRKDVDRIVQEKVDAQLGQLNERHQNELSERDKRLQMRDDLLKGTFQREAAIKAIAANKGDVDLLLPHVLPSIQFDLEEADGKLVPKTKVIDAAGNTRIGDSQGGNMTIDQLVGEMKTSEKFARLFDGSGHTGTGDGGGSGGGSKTTTGKKISQMNRSEKVKLISEIGQTEYNKRARDEREAEE